MAPDYPPYEKYVAHHEAGHAVALIYFFGRGPKVVSLPRFEPGRPYKAHNTIAQGSFSGIQNTVARVERYVLVALAGSAAAHRWAVDNGETFTNQGDEYDREMAAGMLWTACEAGVNIGNNPLPRLERRIAALFQRPKVWNCVVHTTELLLEVREIRDGTLLGCHVKLDLGRRLTKAEAALLASVRPKP